MENILPDAPSENYESANHDHNADPTRINARSDWAATILANIFRKFGPLFCRFYRAAGSKVRITSPPTIRAGCRRADSI